MDGRAYAATSSTQSLTFSPFKHFLGLFSPPAHDPMLRWQPRASRTMPANIAADGRPTQVSFFGVFV